MGDRNVYTLGQQLTVPSYGFNRNAIILGGAHPIITSDLTLNRTTGLFIAPRGFIVVGHSGFVTDLDTNATPLLSLVIGDAADNDRFLTTDTAGRTGGALGAIAAATGVGFQFTADTEVMLTATAAAATAAAGTLTYFMWGYVP